MQTPSRPPGLRVRVFLADDHPVVLGGMKAIVMADPGLELVGSASDGVVALRQALELQPDVAVLDLSMPGMNGVEVAQHLLQSVPSCRILILTVHEDGAYLRQLLDIGVAGYVLKRSATEELSRGIHAVAAGGIYLDPAIAALAIGAAPPPKPDSKSNALADLSAREIEVLQLTSLGHSNKTIAAKLNIGVKTVDTYKARAMSKLGFHSRVEVVRLALSQGWLDEA